MLDVPTPSRLTDGWKPVASRPRTQSASQVTSLSHVSEFVSMGGWGWWGVDEIPPGYLTHARQGSLACLPLPQSSLFSHQRRKEIGQTSLECVLIILHNLMLSSECYQKNLLTIFDRRPGSPHPQTFFPSSTFPFHSSLVSSPSSPF